MNGRLASAEKVESVSTFSADASSSYNVCILFYERKTSNIKKSRGGHFGKLVLQYYNHLARGGYSEIWRNPRPIRACASL